MIRCLMVVLFAVFYLQVNAQNKIEDNIFKKWIINDIKTSNQFPQYYLLLNPNAACQACHKAQLEKINQNRDVHNRVKIISYNEILKMLSFSLHKTINITLKDRKDFNSLNYLRYRNSLIKYENDELYLVLKLSPSNADSVLYWIRK